MDKRDISRAQIKLWFIIGLAFLGGAGMVVYADDAPWRWLQKITVASLEWAKPVARRAD
jgi:hypothetical protein